MENEEVTIDLGRVAIIMWVKKKLIAGIIVSCTVTAIIVAFLLPKQYESTTLVQTRSAGENGGGAAAMSAAMGVDVGSSSKNSPLNYMELMKSRTVLQPIIDNIEWPDEKKKPEPKDFAKDVLKIENTKQTNLIMVTAKGKTPEEARQISQSVVDNFLLMQTDKNQQTQSLLIKFLNDRIAETKKDAEDASQKFADYQREHKIYSPEEQAKSVVSQLNAFDNAIGDMQVQLQASQAKMDSVNAQLGGIKSNSMNFQINDNGNIQTLRKQIVDAEVALVDLHQHYTDENPSVIDAQTHLAELRQKLADEVNTVVASDVATVNPAQMKLIQDRAQAEAGIAVAQASEAAVKSRREAKEKELGSFPDDMLEYMNLQRDASINRKEME
jgi:uncharacterized protein involved in exopolysaccharide biosynthesis